MQGHLKQGKRSSQSGWGRETWEDADVTAGGGGRGGGNFTDKVHIYCLRHKEHGDSKE